MASAILVASEQALYLRKWHRENPLATLIYHANKRAKEANAPGRLTIQDWESVLAAFGDCCLSCGKSEPEVKLVIDHVVPLRLGGPNTVDNIQPLCLPCNTVKGRRSIDLRPARTDASCGVVPTPSP